MIYFELTVFHDLDRIFLEISRDYGVLLEDAGHTLRGLFIIDPKGIIRQITINDLPVGRYVFNTLSPFNSYPKLI